MIYFTKLTGEEDIYDDKVIFTLENINTDKACPIISKYFVDLGYEIIEYQGVLPNGFKKNDFSFKYYDDPWTCLFFCSPNHKMESPEYYEKLERIVQELVDALNRDDHMLHLSK